MNTAAWSPEERAEYAELCQEAWASGTTTGERRDRFVELLRDAQQARRFFANDVLDEALRSGAASVLKRWAKSGTRYLVSHDGRVLNKPAIVGAVRHDEEGNRFHVQTLFDFMTFAQIEDKIVEYAKQVNAYRDDLIVARRLLKLRDLAPDAETPAQAAGQLGTTVAEFLASEPAA